MLKEDYKVSQFREQCTYASSVLQNNVMELAHFTLVHFLR